MPCRGGAPREPTLGIRYNNPGCIRGTKASCAKWPGCLGVGSQGYLRFQTKEEGIRALSRILKLYKSKHDIKTIREVAGRWLKDDHSADEIEAYAKVVGHRAGIHPSRYIDLAAPSVLRRVVRGIIWAENAREDYMILCEPIFKELR